MNDWWEVRAAEDDPSVGELYLYDPISSDGSLFAIFFDDATPKKIKKALDALGDIQRLNIYINSPGGECFASSAIHNLIKRHPAETVAYVDGLAASGASNILMAADRVVVYPNSMIMIHRCWTFMVGNAAELRKEAGILDQIDKTQINTYSAKTGLPKERIARMLDKETWMDADMALELGFADELDTSKTVEVRSTDEGLVVNGREFRFEHYPYLKDAPIERRDEPQRESAAVYVSGEAFRNDVRAAVREALERIDAETRERAESEAQPESRYLPGVEVRIVEYEGEDMPRIEGYAAVFNQWSVPLVGPNGRFREIIRPGAFKEAVEHDDVRCLWNHDRNLVLGRTKSGTLELREDERGLWFSAKPPNAQWAKDAIETVRRGDVDGASFGFAPRKNGDRWNFKGEIAERELLSVRLFDTSPATYPAYPATEIATRSQAPDERGHETQDELDLLELELELALME